MIRTYVDNAMNRKLGRVGLPVGSAVYSKSSGSPGSFNVPKTYVDNAMNRRLNRVGLPLGTAVHRRGSPSMSPDSVRTYVDNAMNQRLGRIGLPLGTDVDIQGSTSVSPDPVSRQDRKAYRDNDFDLKHTKADHRVGSKPEQKSDERQYFERDTYFDESLYGRNHQESDNQRNKDVVNLKYLNKQEDLWIESADKIARSFVLSTGGESSSPMLKGSFTRFEDLDLKEKIGHGDFGDVYFAISKLNSAVVAVKILKQTNVTKKRLEKFQKEKSSHSRLNHPNVVKYYGYCLGGRNLAFVMEYMDTCLWISIHIHEIDFHPDHKLKILRDITSGLAHLHSLSLVHGNLKTQNVLLNNVPGLCEYDNTLPVINKLSDFGLNLLKLDAETSLPKACLRVAAPEVIQGKILSTSEMYKADVYSMGMLIFELVVEEIPFEDLSVLQLIHQVGTLAVKPALPQGHALDRGLEDLLHLCWSFDPVKRPDGKDLAEMAISVKSLFIEEE
ncbi:serine/threonine-protein kinase ctr1 [Plakobranchus ocellatus]|uniref:Serine/threonine-protein kinase ctr1 n=1 Tax=Plakobranchus ocellatus TaxID=259542 RepID=A0AAV4ALJ4_9GAST|nr:serine/threonine-protein kinase ctr1 [Plakobranchus ocellatus]